MSNLNMPVKYCTDENDNKFSPVVYQESMFNDDGTRMDPVPRKMFAKAYDPTKTYPTESLFCINDNKFYKFTGSGTTTGTFDSTKWTETDDAEELTTLNSTLTKRTSTRVTFVANQYVLPFESSASFSCSALGISRDRVVSVIPHCSFSVCWYAYADDNDTIALAGRTTQTINVDIIYV